MPKLSPQEARATWIAALRSGNYNQCAYKLHCNNSYCCLGVACELYLKHEEGLSHKIKIIGGREIHFYDGNDNDLPEKVMTWLGLHTHLGDYNLSCLSVDNDRGQTFDYIANLIESAPPRLLVEEFK